MCMMKYVEFLYNKKDHPSGLLIQCIVMHAKKNVLVEFVRVL